MIGSSRANLTRYGAAVLAAILALALRMSLDFLLEDRYPFATLFFGVIFSAWYGGFGPALTTCFLGGLGAAHFLLPPQGSFRVEGFTPQAGLALYLATGFGIALVGGSMWSSQRRTQVLAETALRQGEELRITLHSIGDGVITTDVRGRITFLNPVARELTGWPLEEARDQPLDRVFRIIHEHTRQPTANPVFQALDKREVVELANHTLLLSRDGKERPIEDSAAPIMDKAGNILGVVLIFRDVTGKRRAEEDRKRLAAIVESSEDAIIAKTLEGIITSWNQGAEKLYGYSQAEAVGQPFSILVPEGQEKEVEETARYLRQGDRLEHFETVRRRKDGSVVDVSVGYSPIKDREGRIIGTSVIARDISAKKRNEEALRRSTLAVRENEERLRLSLDAGRMGIWDWNLLTNDLKWSENLEPIHGLAPGTFKGTFQAFQELVHPDDREPLQKAIAQSLNGQTGFELEFRTSRPDGQVQWMAGKGKVFHDETGRPVRMVGVGMDISERKQSQERQRRAEMAARFLAEASATLAGIVDIRTTLQEVARLAVPFFADWCVVDLFEPENSLVRVAMAHVDPRKVELANELHRRYPPDPKSPIGAWNILRTGTSQRIAEISDDLLEANLRDPEQLRIVRELGLRSYLGVPIRVRDRVLGAFLFTAAESGRHYDENDLSLAEDLAHRTGVAMENAKLYEALRESDRRKNEFLAVLAHELRNPLAPVRNALHVLKMPQADPVVREQVRAMAERQVYHLTRLVDDLLDVSRIMRGKIELRIERIEVATLIQRAVETARPTIDAEEHELTILLPSEPTWLNADLVRMSQVVSNLLQNAARYTERGGKIHLTAGAEGGELFLRVRDNGIGIAPEAMPHLFQMFMQASPGAPRSQGGLGIGLTLVKSLVELHQGKVEVHSAGLGQGSEFVVRLPLAAPEIAHSPKVPPCAETTPPRCKLLIIDDNRDAADSLGMVLGLEGHSVEVAYDGVQGLQAVQGRMPEVVFLDLGMPGMNGFEIARRLRAMTGGDRIFLVALTGWGQEQDRERTRQAGFDLHLTKPVEPGALRKLIASISPAGGK